MPLIFLALASSLARTKVDSGLKVGDMVSAFEPTHVCGPDSGTQTCPVCKYGKLPAVQVWLSHPSVETVRSYAALLDQDSSKSKHNLKTFIVVLTSTTAGPGLATEAQVKAAFGKKYAHVGITTLPSKDEAVGSYAVNTKPEVTDTVFVYKDLRVQSKFVNLKGDSKGLAKLQAAIFKVDK